MTLRMTGKGAIVTGAGGGIGAAIAELFCSEGASVLLFDHDSVILDETVSRLRSLMPASTIETYVGDVANFDDTVQAVELAFETFGHLNVLVNNAAVRNHSSVATSDAADWHRLLSVNLMGTVNFCKAAVQQLRQSTSSSVVNVSSCYGVVGRKGMPIYDATKAAILSLTRTFAHEEAANGIRVNAVCPGGTLTPFTIGRGVASGRKADEMPQDVRSDSLLRRWGQPKEVAYPVLWLASDESSYVTGTTIMVDGGLHII